MWRKKVSEVSGGEVRTAKAVKKKWSDMASSLKRKEAASRREINMTGGGELVGEDLSGVEQRVVGMLAVEAIDGVEGGVDVGVERQESVEKDSLDMNEQQQFNMSKKRGNEMDEVLVIERKRLAVEEERLPVEKWRLAVDEKRRLAVEEERLNFEKTRYMFQPADEYM